MCPRVQPRVSPVGPPGGVSAGCACTACSTVAGDRQGVPGVQGVPWSTRDTRNTPGRTSAYTGCLLLKARAGRGKNGARDSVRTVPEQCNNRTRYPTPANPTPTTRHPSTRHPPPVMYPGYVVTQCRRSRRLLLLYPISAKVTCRAGVSHACVIRRVYNKLLMI